MTTDSLPWARFRPAKALGKADISARQGAAPRCQPVDSALARTVTEHFHCGEPMALVDDTVLPITAPLIILTPDTVSPETRQRPVPTYRCQCGFGLDAPAEKP